MLLLKRPVVRNLPELQASSSSPLLEVLSNGTNAEPSQNVEVAPRHSVRTVPPLRSYGERAWKSAQQYVRVHGVSEPDVNFAAMTLLKLARDVSVVELRAGREVILIHPAFRACGPFLNERGRQMPFQKIASQALLSADAERLSIFCVDGELEARSPSWSHVVGLRDLMPEPWYAAVKAMGQQAMSAPKLNRFHYEAKLYLIAARAGEGSAGSSRIMIQSRRRESGQMRQFKGDSASWAQAAE